MSDELLPNRRYQGIGIENSNLIESPNTGTMGVAMRLITEDGGIDHTIWLPKELPKDASAEAVKKRTNAIKRAGHQLKILGATPETLKSPAFWKNVGTFLDGPKEFSFVTVEETYNEKTRVKAQFINEKNVGLGAGSVSQRAAILFGASEDVIAEDEADVPF